MQSLVYQSNEQFNMDEESYDGGDSLHESNPAPSSSSGSKCIVWQWRTKEKRLTRQLSCFLRPYYDRSNCFSMINKQYYVQKGAADNNN